MLAGKVGLAFVHLVRTLRGGLEPFSVFARGSLPSEAPSPS